MVVEPTIAGEAAIDPFHMYARFKRLRKKPIDKIWGTDDYLFVAQAEKDGLLRVKIEVQGTLFRWVVRYPCVEVWHHLSLT